MSPEFLKAAQAEIKSLTRSLEQIKSLLRDNGIDPDAGEPGKALAQDPVRIIRSAEVAAPFEVPPPFFKRDIDVGMPASIAYAQEAQSFLAAWPSDTFKIADFKDYLSTKFGSESINEQSMRGPFAKMAKRGDIEIFRKGLGKLPVIYRKKKEPNPFE